MVIYDNGQFLQWLEGPADNLKRVVSSIRRDRRHTDIEMIGEQPTPVRFFDGWALKLGQKKDLRRSDNAAGGVDGVFEDHEMAQRASVAPPPSVESPWHSNAHKETDPSALELATLLLGHPAHAATFIHKAALGVQSSTSLFRRLFEPAARVLGDFWSEDRCTEFDVTIALVQLQTAMRAVNTRIVRVLKSHPRKVLIVPRPGELHMLSAVLNAEALWQAGWEVRCAFPNTDRDLQTILTHEYFDALDLSLSPAMTRAHFLPSLAVTISRARAASQNNRLAVVTSGRLFSERANCQVDVGADASSPSSSCIETVLLRAFDVRSQ